MSAIPGRRAGTLLHTANEWLHRALGRNGNKNILISIFVIAALVNMLVTLPPFVMDILLSLNILLALILLMMTIFAAQPLHFSTFPSVLLVLTLYRLSLNIATTRLILSRGREGIDAAGSLIAT
ncbi:MAG: FHIPEP family type III secretion protein, partial [Planctomycetes bacterium]|nr:FHIPEP family type III secretion protein [Planctomycetota bacterium]